MTAPLPFTPSVSPPAASPAQRVDGCPLCPPSMAGKPSPLWVPEGCIPLWHDAAMQLVRVQRDGVQAVPTPAFWRLLWRDHVAEFCGLSPSQRHACMDAIATVERTIIGQLQPTKMNLATLGNLVPHLHWHIVARFDWDSHYPAPVWAAAQRHPPEDKVAWLQEQLPTVDAALALALHATHGGTPTAPPSSTRSTEERPAA